MPCALRHGLGQRPPAGTIAGSKARDASCGAGTLPAPVGGGGGFEAHNTKTP